MQRSHVMKRHLIGTLIRCSAIDERRIAFYKRIGLYSIQIAGVYEDWLSPAGSARKASDEMFSLFNKYDITVPAMFLSYPNQDWVHPETTVGLVPEKFRAERMVISCRQMNWAKHYGIKYITCHVGFVPDEKNEFYDRFIAEMKQLVRFAASNDQQFLFETGTETAASLKHILDDIGEPNLGINFDPANLLIYGKDDPSVLVDQLADRIRVVHCKDANRAVNGDVFGKETVLGCGSANIPVLLKKLLEAGFCGPLIIERELPPGPEQEKDIAEAVKLIQSIAD